MTHVDVSRVRQHAVRSLGVLNTTTTTIHMINVAFLDQKRLQNTFLKILNVTVIVRCSL